MISRDKAGRIAALVLAGAVGGVVAHALSRLFPPPPRVPPIVNTGVVRTRMLEVVDDKGDYQAVVMSSPQGGMLVLRDAARNPVLIAGRRENATIVEVLPAGGQGPYAELAASDGAEAGLVVFNAADKKPVLFAGRRGGSTRLRVSPGDKGPDAEVVATDRSKAAFMVFEGIEPVLFAGRVGQSTHVQVAPLGGKGPNAELVAIDDSQAGIAVFEDARKAADPVLFAGRRGERTRLDVLASGVKGPRAEVYALDNAEAAVKVLDAKGLGAVVATVSAEARSQPSLTINDHAGKPFWSVSCDE